MATPTATFRPVRDSSGQSTNTMTVAKTVTLSAWPEGNE